MGCNLFQRLEPGLDRLTPRFQERRQCEVVAQGGDTERVVMLADNLIDNTVAVFALVSMTLFAQSLVPGLFFVGTMLLSGLAATLFGPRLEKAARRTVAQAATAGQGERDLRRRRVRLRL